MNQNPKNTKLEEQIDDIALDLICVGLPKDCALVGDTIVCPPRKKVLKENRGKDWAKAIEAIINLIQDRERKAIKTHFRNWWTDSCRDKARVMTKVPVSEYYDELNKGEK